MNKICTDLEQSQKLIELGIDVKTTDMFWDMAEPEKRRKPLIGPISDYYDMENWAVPAWSITALLGLMPFQIIENNNRFGFYQVKGFNKQGETYRFGYKTNNNSFLFETSWHNDVVDATFEMICWLKENNKI